MSALPVLALVTAFSATPLDVDTIASSTIDANVYGTLLPNTRVDRAGVVASAIDATLSDPAHAPPRLVVPVSRPLPVDPALRPVRIDVGAAAANRLQLAGETVMLHADGLPTPNLPSSDPAVRVLPRAVNPLDVAFGARWGAEDRIPAPLLNQISWDTHADLIAGAPPVRPGTVRRSLRLTAQWDRPEDITIGLTPGVERTGGTFFEHYVAGLQASTLDKTQVARWRSFVEVSGEKIAPNNLIDNSTATVRAGATYSTSPSAQFDVSVTRGTTALPDLQSSLGLSLRF